MGLDPENDNFEGGVRCDFCEDSVFGGKTPKYLEAHFVNIAKCPGATTEPPNRVFLLEQTPVPCTWVFNDFVYLVTLQFTAVGSVLGLFELPKSWFRSIPALQCVLRFTNELACNGIAIAGTGGIGAIIWGPTIGP